MLPPKAYAVLRHLIERAGRMVTQDELLDAVWPDTHIQPEGLKSQILHIRRVLGDHAKRPRFIETLPRRGYRFIGADGQGGVQKPAVQGRPAPSNLVGRERALGELGDGLRRALQSKRQIASKSHQRHEEDAGTTTTNECHQCPPNRDHGLPLWVRAR